jgi:hypothetical protein
VLLLALLPAVLEGLLPRGSLLADELIKRLLLPRFRNPDRMNTLLLLRLALLLQACPPGSGRCRHPVSSAGQWRIAALQKVRSTSVDIKEYYWAVIGGVAKRRETNSAKRCVCNTDAVDSASRRSVRITSGEEL